MGALELLKMWRGLVREGGVPRYSVLPGAALNTLVTWTDAAIARGEGVARSQAEHIASGDGDD